MHPREKQAHLHANAFTGLLTAAQFVKSPNWRHPECPSTGVNGKQIAVSCTTECFSQMQRHKRLITWDDMAESQHPCAGKKASKKSRYRCFCLWKSLENINESVMTGQTGLQSKTAHLMNRVERGPGTKTPFKVTPAITRTPPIRPHLLVSATSQIVPSWGPRLHHLGFLGTFWIQSIVHREKATFGDMIFRMLCVHTKCLGFSLI
jgi:hypothetical protein